MLWSLPSGSANSRAKHFRPPQSLIHHSGGSVWNDYRTPLSLSIHFEIENFRNVC